MKRQIKNPVTFTCSILGTLSVLLLLVACGTVTLEKPDTNLLDTQALQNTLANPVPLPNGSLYPSSHPIEDDNEAKLATRAKKLLKTGIYSDPSFDNPHAWNCFDPSNIVENGTLKLGTGGCKQILSEPEAGTYYLTCRGSVDILNSYSVFGLRYTDSEEKTTESFEPLSYIRKQRRISVDIPSNVQELSIEFYTEAPASHDYCYLSNKTQPKLVTETIYEPAKPLEVLVPLYIDPDIVISSQDTETDVVALESWKSLIRKAKNNPDVPMTVILDPSYAPKKGNTFTVEESLFCQYGGFVTPVERVLDGSKTIKINNVLRSLQKAGVDTIGYVPTGFGKTDVETIKKFIDRIEEQCPYLDGIFFDEATLNNDTISNYTTVCDYARSIFPNGKFVLNAGLNFSVDLNNQNCNIAIPYEQTPQGKTGIPGASWKNDYAAYGFDGSVGQPAAAALIHSNMTNQELRRNVDLAYSRKFDYIYVTDLTLQEAILPNNPWFSLGSNWGNLVKYVDKKNRSLTH